LEGSSKGHLVNPCLGEFQLVQVAHSFGPPSSGYLQRQEFCSFFE